MNLLTTIHERWAASTALNALLPVARLFTGACGDALPPLASILKRSDQPDSYQSDGSAIDVVVLRMHILHADYVAAAQIIHQIKKTFDRTTFDLDGGDRVQNMQRINDGEQQRDDGVWKMTIDFQCTVYLASGV
ncbi:MAG: DUF3168 domain-containing protein [Thermoguttaceae bacterium]